MSATDGFDLRALVREVADSSTIPDPTVLAQEVARRIPAKQRAEAPAQALPLVVSIVVSRTRSPITPGGHSERGNHMHHAAGGASRKVASIRNTWRKALRDRIAIGDRQWAFLGDCTVENLEYAASVREAHARQNAERAAQYRELIDRMERAGALTVSQLSDVDLGDALGAAA